MPKIKVNNPKNIIKGTPTRYYFKLHNTSGPKGDKGDTGATGAQGPKGDTGNAATIHVGSTTTLPVGQDATVENVGSQYAAVLNFGIPQGPQGPKGDKGDTGATGATGPQGATGAKGDPGQNATVYIGTTTTGAPGTQASVYNSGTENNAVLNFTIPQGAQGDLGPANTLSIGSVTKGADAGATITGDAPNQTLNLVLPKGDTGATGPTGPQGPQGVPGVQGVPGKDFSIYKTYASVADMNADAANVPEGEFVMIASTTEDPDNAKLYVKNGEGTFTYLSDLSGAQGIQGPRGEQGVPGPQGIPGPTGPTGPRGSVKSQYVAELPASGDEDTFYLVDKDLESHAESGEYINFETTQTAAAIQSAQLNGNATQTTYSGKNLFNKDATPDAITAGTTATPQSAGVQVKQSVSGNYKYATYYLSDVPSYVGKNVVVSATMSASGSNVPRVVIGLCAQDGSDKITKRYIEATGSTSFALTAEDIATRPYIYLFLYSNVTGTAQANDYATFTNVQVEISSDTAPTSYEPYVGGIPAPNPSYPQPISVVTGGQTVKVVGKNLWSFDSSYVNTDSVRKWVLGDTDFPLQAGTYTVSCKVTPASKTVRINYEYADGANHITDIAPNPATITFTEDVQKIALQLGSDATVSEIQLEQGSTATSYEAYTAQDYTISLGELELAKIGTYQDRIYKDGEKWYVEKQVGKVVLDGSEAGWSAELDNAFITIADAKGTSAIPVLSDYFTYKQAYSQWGEFRFGVSNNNLIFRNAIAQNTNLAGWKTWLSAHPTAVYYALATPTTTEITNQSLIDQLEALASATLNQGVNNIFTEIATGNAMPTLELNWVEWEKYNRHNVYIWNDDIDDWQVIVS